MSGRSSNSPGTTIVTCPTCGKDVPWIAESRFKPFCSERCRLIDLGAWADGSYCIPAEPAPIDDEPDDPASH